MEKVKSIVTKYWYVVLPLAVVGVWFGWQWYKVRQVTQAASSPK